MSMWEPFTEDARGGIRHAQDVAQRYGSTFIDQSHMFAGLAQTQTIAHVLQLSGISMADLAAGSERVFGPQRAPSSSDLQFSPYAKRLIELAFVNAQRLDQHFIDAEHLMLGYLDLGEAEKSLARELNLDEEKFRRNLIESLEPKPKGTRSESAARQETTFEQTYHVAAQFANRRRASELWKALQSSATEQSDSMRALIYALALASQEASSSDDLLRRMESRMRELFGE
jgi:ATP-dependent Clp protease ATP-binding subunit ClpC